MLATDNLVVVRSLGDNREATQVHDKCLIPIQKHIRCNMCAHGMPHSVIKSIFVFTTPRSRVLYFQVRVLYDAARQAVSNELLRSMFGQWGGIFVKLQANLYMIILHDNGQVYGK